MAMNTLLERKDEKGIYRVLFLSDEHAHGEPAGLYADIAYFGGQGPGHAPHGFNKLCGSYREAAHKVFQAHGEYPEYAQGF